MPIEAIQQPVIGFVFGMQDQTGFDVAVDRALYLGLVVPGYGDCYHIPAPLAHPEHGPLTNWPETCFEPLVGVLVLLFAADVGLVDLYDTG